MLWCGLQQAGTLHVGNRLLVVLTTRSGHTFDDAERRPRRLARQRYTARRRPTADAVLTRLVSGQCEVR